MFFAPSRSVPNTEGRILTVNKNKYQDLIDILPLALVVITATILFGIASHLVIEESFPERLLDLWNTWDVQQYIRIAEHGYQGLTVDGRNLQIVFLPLYPLLIKIFSYVFQNYIISSLVVSNLSYIAAVYYLYKLVKEDFDKEDAFRAVIYFSVFPTAYFMHAGYTESLFLALTIGSFYYARTQKWWLSGTLGMLAAATRITGVLLIPVLLLEYFAARENKLRNIRADILWIALVGLGLISYLFINYQISGDPLYFMEIQREHWHKRLDFPYEGLKNAIKITTGEMALNVNTPSARMLAGPAEIIFAALALILTIYSFFRLRLSYSIYALITWLVITSTWLWLSIPRYVLAMFPIFIVMALLGRRRWVNYLILFVSVLFYALFLSLFVRFKWAF